MLRCSGIKLQTQYIRGLPTSGRNYLLFIMTCSYLHKETDNAVHTLINKDYWPGYLVKVSLPDWLSITGVNSLSRLREYETFTFCGPKAINTEVVIRLRPHVVVLHCASDS